MSQPSETDNGGSDSKSGPKIGTNKRPTATPDKARLRATYSRLLHELQYRAIRNALMNYHEAEKLEKKATTFGHIANMFTGASASGLLVGIAQKGKLLANKAGVAGVVGLPICGAIQLLGHTTSDLVPNYTELAKRHIKTAAGWVGLAETARVERTRIIVDPDRDVSELATVYSHLTDRRTQVSSETMIPQKTHEYFSKNPELVCAAMKQKGDNYKKFVELEREHFASSPGNDKPGNEKPVNVIYY